MVARRSVVPGFLLFALFRVNRMRRSLFLLSMLSRGSGCTIGTSSSEESQGRESMTSTRRRRRGCSSSDESLAGATLLTGVRSGLALSSLGAVRGGHLDCPVSDPSEKLPDEDLALLRVMGIPFVVEAPFFGSSEFELAGSDELDCFEAGSQSQWFQPFSRAMAADFEDSSSPTELT
ncbi:hypothetical protein F2Q69_00005244 [Brassica cretica]|uniref:Uncharacterized protein n=1 Tax=Brassica cretica TaxID=69181 RepID=A0A8S9P9U2_BRACR|nr:hypothetical protein F2Q69_00005244 [Brassica cretica]